MFVLGIDPGLSTTGYGVVEHTRNGTVAVAAGVIRTDRNLPIAARLQELYTDLAGVIAEYAPQEGAIEQVFVNQNLRTATAVARASGVAMLAMAEAGIPVAEYTPSAVKHALAGFGGADKSQVQQVVAMRLGLDLPPGRADAADALAIALCHVQTSPVERLAERTP
jgi:crossover junction endodeoxyribonuclease RuvC